MSSTLFFSAKLKVERAEHHITDFERTFRRFAELNPDALTASHSYETGQGILTVHFGKLPPVILSLILADAIHNLRAALDHANWELRGLDGGAQNRYTKLPVGEDRVSYESLCGGIVTPTGDLPDFFKALEFFKDGKGHLIYALHDLDVEDKHMILPVVTSSVAVRVKAKNEFSITFNEPPGTDPPKIPFVVSKTPLKINQDANSPLDIGFGKPCVFEFKPVIPTLVHLRDVVNQTIGQFERLVSDRKSASIFFRDGGV